MSFSRITDESDVSTPMVTFTPPVSPVERASKPSTSTDTIEKKMMQLGRRFSIFLVLFVLSGASSDIGRWSHILGKLGLESQLDILVEGLVRDELLDKGIIEIRASLQRARFPAPGINAILAFLDDQIPKYEYGSRHYLQHNGARPPVKNDFFEVDFDEPQEDQSEKTFFGLPTSSARPKQEELPPPPRRQNGSAQKSAKPTAPPLRRRDDELRENEPEVKQSKGPPPTPLLSKDEPTVKTSDHFFFSSLILDHCFVRKATYH